MYSEELELVSDTNYKVYTPLPIARKMVASIFKVYFDSDNKRKLDEFRAADIACGTGNLLLVLLEELIRISKIYYGEYRYNEEWIEGFDIDQDALIIFKKRFDKLLNKYKLSGKLKVKHANSLLEPIEGRYNVVIGNPPYLGEKNNREIFDRIRETDFGKKYYEGRMDYLYFFIEKGIDALKKDGIMSYITTNYWLRADYASKLRGKLKDECNFSYIRNYNKSVFKNAIGQHNIVFTLKKGSHRYFKVEDEGEEFVSDNNYLYDRDGKLVLASEEKLQYFNKILNKKNYYLSDILNINQGIVSGCDRAFVMKEFNKEFESYLKPFYKNSDVNRYSYNSDNKYWILYLNKGKKPCDKVLKHMEVYTDRLHKRREVKNKRKAWWELQWARDEKIFNVDKIVGRQRSIDNKFALVQGEFYASADVYYLTAKEEVDLYYILAYLNSKVFYEWFRYNGKSKGDYLELYATPLKNTPIYYPDNEKEIEYISNLSRLAMEGRFSEVEEELENYFQNLYINN